MIDVAGSDRAVIARIDAELRAEQDVRDTEDRERRRTDMSLLIIGYAYLAYLFFTGAF